MSVFSLLGIKPPPDPATLKVPDPPDPPKRPRGRPRRPQPPRPKHPSIKDWVDRLDKLLLIAPDWHVTQEELYTLPDGTERLHFTLAWGRVPSRGPWAAGSARVSYDQLYGLRGPRRKFLNYVRTWTGLEP